MEQEKQPESQTESQAQPQEEVKKEVTIEIDQTFDMKDFISKAQEATHLIIKFGANTQPTFDSQHKIIKDIFEELNNQDVLPKLKSLSLNFEDANITNQPFILPPQLKENQLRELIFKFNKVELSKEQIKELSEIVSTFKTLLNCEIHMVDLRNKAKPFWDFIYELLNAVSTHPSYILYPSTTWFNSVIDCWLSELPKPDDDCEKMIPLILTSRLCRVGKFNLMNMCRAMEGDEKLVNAFGKRQKNIIMEIGEQMDFVLNRDDLK